MWKIYSTCKVAHLNCVFCSLTGQNFPYNLSIARQWVAIMIYPCEDVLRSRAFGPSITRSDNTCFDHLSMKLTQSTAWNKKRFGLILGVRKCWTHGWRKTKKAETSTIEARKKKGVKQRKSYTRVWTLDRCLNRSFSWGHEKKSSIELTEP